MQIIAALDPLDRPSVYVEASTSVFRMLIQFGEIGPVAPPAQKVAMLVWSGVRAVESLRPRLCTCGHDSGTRAHTHRSARFRRR